MGFESSIYWLALMRCPKFNFKLYLRLCNLLDNLFEIFTLPPNELGLFGLSAEQINYFSNLKHSMLEAEATWLSDNSIAMIDINAECYPELLKEITMPPLVLFVKGDVSCLNHPQFAFVGSRNPSPYGVGLTKKLAADMACTNALVTSGMAIGIDGIAHQSCINTGGKTIAVLGSGFKHLYPKRHAQLAKQIEQQGALVTEFLPDTPPIHYNFPKRNRIISGLSNGTLVVEAAEKSGSLVTAKYALEQGREVFTVPGNINNPLAKGPHLLLRQGAKLVENLDDIIEDFVFVTANAKIEQKKNLADSELLASVDHDTTPVDVIVQRSNLPVDQVLTELLDLEVRGLVAAVPGGYIRQA